ncbi:uncharacterized protein C18orf63-like [Ruditapes philippinarum]|uniref:uncharacterized protein C18orf63-like n=1 Tax=Ruditapes philippinarum TaxID=129788 RepID=UPI00295C32D2|nr:uncharacterized protein C18orf63-like [Ruditapes philippinarum]
MYDGNTKPLILFATPPPLEQLCALTIRLSTTTQSAAKFQPQVIKCREFIFTEPEVIGTPSPDITDHCFHLVAKVSFINSGKLQARISRIGLQVTTPYKVTTELYESCLRYTLLARLSPNWNKAGPWLIQGRDFLTHKGCANAVKMNVNVHQNELFFTLEAAVLKLAPLHVTDLDIIGNHLKVFLTNPMAQLDHDSIASDWCFILPSMKRGRIVSISHEIPEDSPFKTYRDLKRHWKNTYGYRLPESEDDINFYQIRFGPQGGKLFTYPFCFNMCKNICEYISLTLRTYPEVCLRGRELQKVARVDPKPILRSFMLEIQSKFPTVCGCPIKLQSKAKFTVTDLLPSGQNTIKDHPNLTNKMSSSRPTVYRTKDEMVKMMASSNNTSIPNPTNCSQSLNGRKETVSVISTKNISQEFSDRSKTLDKSVTPNNQERISNQSFRCIANSKEEAQFSRNILSENIRPITKEHPDSDKSSINSNNEMSAISVALQSGSQNKERFIRTPENASKVGINSSVHLSAYTPTTSSSLMNKQETGSHKLIPQFKPKKLLPLIESAKPVVAQKIVPVFHPQKKSSTGCISQQKSKSTVNKAFISHTPSRPSVQGHLTSVERQGLPLNTPVSTPMSSSVNNASALTPLNRPTFSKTVPLFKKSVTASTGCVPSNSGKATTGKDGKLQKEKKATKRPKATKKDGQNESRKAKKLKKAEA